MTFKKLHQQDKPLIVCNVWDVASTKVAEKLGFQVVGTSSAAIAALLGYDDDDGESMSFDELGYFVKRIMDNTSLMLTVDLESGYSRSPEVIVKHIKFLAKLGVVGINIEDSVVDGRRTLSDANDFAKIIFPVKRQLEKENLDIFLNIRTDTFLLKTSNILEETEKRIKLYEEAGADGIFIPCIEKESDIKNVVDKISLPVNVMCMPHLPNFNKLQALGVKRISMGNFLFDKMTQSLEHNLSSIKNSQSFEPIF